MDVATLSQVLEALKRIGKNGDAAGTLSVFARLAQIADYVDTLETKLGLNTDAAGTATVFARLAQLVGYTDTLETLLGAANPTTGGTDTIFKFLKQINDYVDTLEAQLGLKTDTASGTGTLHAKVSNVNGNIGVHGDTNNSLHSKTSTILSSVGVHGDTNNSLQGKIGSTTDLPSTNGSLHAKVNKLLANAAAEGGFLGDWESLPSTPFGQNGKMIFANNNLYHFKGGSLEFYRYNLSAGTWVRLADAPYFLDKGACMAWTGGDYIYALSGSGMNNGALYRYSISINTWAILAAFPVPMGSGASLVWTGGDFLFALAGGNSNLFQRYSISGNTWTTLTAPTFTNSVQSGATLSYFGGDVLHAQPGNNVTTVSAYKISANTWHISNSLWVSEGNIEGFKKGANAAYTGGDYAFFTHAGGTNEISRYSISQRKWYPYLTPLPATVDETAGLAYGQDGYIYATRGAGNTQFYRAPIISTPNAKSWMQ